ncbi:hypothetical protein C6P97_20280 [Burkholderia multivorans]|uniref:Uncharacterized protein n=1 Tax=Burkholderia multivorans TaxID=87883 RepID=A0AB37ALW8_9BURK|nr:hypothetical protein C6P99_30910 [Burkholderia multivorans]PRE45846.1 hypothetical protein C6P97_20280 [Burkholderia multivorans]
MLALVDARVRVPGAAPVRWSNRTIARPHDRTTARPHDRTTARPHDRTTARRRPIFPPRQIKKRHGSTRGVCVDRGAASRRMRSLSDARRRPVRRSRGRRGGFRISRPSRPSRR